MESGLPQTAHSPSKHKDKHGFISSNICAAYADVEFLVLIYLIYFLYFYLSFPLFGQHKPCFMYCTSICISHLEVVDLFIRKLCCIVYMERKATFRLFCLKTLVTCLISGLKCVNATHFYVILSYSPVGFVVCFLVIILVLRLRIISVEYLSFSAIVSFVFHFSCFDFSVAGIVIILFI